MTTKLLLVATVVLALLASGLAHADTIYELDPFNGIYKFDSSGNKTFFASLPGRVPGGLAFGRGGNLYTMNYANYVEFGLYKFDSSGNSFHLSWGPGNECINDIAFDSGGNLYAAGQWGNIYKFDPNNDMTVFTSGIAMWSRLAFDSSGNLYVSEYGIDRNGQILKFDSSGNRSIFASGLYLPEGLAFDKSGNLFVALFNDNTKEYGQILKFDSSGNMSIFASELNGPGGLAFDNSGNLYVTNYWDGTIMKFDSNGNSTIFASGLTCPEYITIVPEPASAILIGTGFFFVRLRRKQN